MPRGVVLGYILRRMRFTTRRPLNTGEHRKELQQHVHEEDGVDTL